MIYYEYTRMIKALKDFGFKAPLLDVGGVENVVLPDYTGLSGVKGLYKPQPRPWSFLQNDYEVNHHVGEGDAPGGPLFNTILSSSTLEHVSDPFGFFVALKKLLAPGGLLLLTTVFRWYVHGDKDHDLWRFTSYGLKTLSDKAGLTLIDHGHFEIDLQREPVYLFASNGPLDGARSKDFVEPKLERIETW